MTTPQRDDLVKLLMPKGSTARRWASLRREGATNAIVAAFIRDVLRDLARAHGGRDGCVCKLRAADGRVWAKIAGDRRSVTLWPDDRSRSFLRMDGQNAREAGPLVARARQAFHVTTRPPVVQQALFT